MRLGSRHITLTTITTGMEFMSLLLGGDGFWPPFGIIIAGGTLLTSMVSFFFVPTDWIDAQGKAIGDSRT